ncbi:MAG: GFA family protein [Hyphomicrobiales bacterium]|nr:GFA family protein [Hyphomicrobiales bacterium]
MVQDKIERRLAAIVVADVVGYSRMMGEDEAATLHALQEHRFALIDPTIGQHHGRIVKSMGDGLLVEFQSVHDAVECAIAIQRGMVSRNAGMPQDRQIRLRIGVNLGDVLIEDGDIYGDGVNIAARLQETAEANGVSISSSVFRHIQADTDHSFSDIGAHEFKNIAKPVRVYHHSEDPSARPVHAAFRPFVDLPVDARLLIKGGCLCGNVRYEFTEKALGSMLCHCRMCQKFSGAPVLGGTTFLTEALRFTKGSPKFYQSSHIAERGFCGDCGTALLYRGLIGVWTKWIMVFTASLDEPEKFPPTYHLGIESSMPWLNIHDELSRTMCKDSPSLIEAYKSVGEEVP